MNGFDLHFSAVIQAAFLLLFLKSPHLASWFACRIVTPAFTKLNWITKVWVTFSNIYPQIFSQANAVGADQVPSMIWKDAVWVILIFQDSLSQDPFKLSPYLMQKTLFYRSIKVAIRKLGDFAGVSTGAETGASLIRCVLRIFSLFAVHGGSVKL